MSENLSLQTSRMKLRRVPFSYERNKESTRLESGHWNLAKPEFSHIVNAASLAMPFLEPYLIASMRKARPLLRDPKLQSELDLYVAQEASHSQQHKRFNRTIREAGYASVENIEAVLASDYRKMGEQRSLRFNLAYAEGFESMALAIGHMLIEDRKYFFGGSNSSIASLILWHFVEEIEHKNVAFDVYKHIYGSYFWRIFGLFYATGHIFWRTGRGYRELLKEDGLWTSLKSRWNLTKVLLRIFRRLIPKMAKILKPNYHPEQIADSQWAEEWTRLYNIAPKLTSQLDTYRLDEKHPQSLPA